MTSKRRRPALGVVLDTGALLAIERGDRAVLVLLATVRAEGSVLTVPAGCVAQAWRAPARQARLATFLRITEVSVVPFDDDEARRIGLLLARARRSDVVDAHVALCALRQRQTVLTSDPDDIRAFDRSIQVKRV